ncbi:hypothetical protein EDD86DRAFT_205415 [Gorgonomyces haynaldii]|nr:hypothetical protein EDD86DRAFT_205415 [Gorgonomyces haynaldii]
MLHKGPDRFFSQMLTSMDEWLPISAATILVHLILIILILMKKLALFNRALPLLTLLLCSLVFQGGIFAYSWYVAHGLTGYQARGWYLILNCYWIVLVAFTFNMEVEYCKIVSVVGKLSSKFLGRVQVFLLLFMLMLFLVPALGECVIVFSSHGTDVGPLLRDWMLIGSYVGESLLFFAELCQLVYIYITVTSYVKKQSTMPKAYMFMLSCLLLTGVGDFAALIFIIPAVGKPLPAMLVLLLVHLPIIAVNIHFLNQILLPVRELRVRGDSERRREMFEEPL